MQLRKTGGPNVLALSNCCIGLKQAPVSLVRVYMQYSIRPPYYCTCTCTYLRSEVTSAESQPVLEYLSYLCSTDKAFSLFMKEQLSTIHIII